MSVIFIKRPSIFVGCVTKATSEDSFLEFRVYRTEEGEYLNWSAKLPLPRLGDRVNITTNESGQADVVGFFKEEGYIGVVTKATDPHGQFESVSVEWNALPDWRKKGVGCHFGAEVGLLD